MTFRPRMRILGWVLAWSPYALLAQYSQVLTLDQSIAVALKNNFSLISARQSIDEAKAALGEARTGFLPKFTGSAGYTKLDVAPFMPGKVFEDMMGGFSSIPGISSTGFPNRIPIGRDEITSIGVQVQQPLFTGFSILNGFRMAREGVNAAQAQYQKAKNDLVFQVEEAYWGIVKAKKFIGVSEEAVRQMEGHVKDLENMHSVGMLTRNDLLKARVQLSNTRLMVIQARNGFNLASEAFCILLGIPPESPVEPMEDLVLDTLTVVDLERAGDLALDRRPEIGMFRSGISVGQRNVDLARAGYLPSLIFVADYGYRKPNREYAMDFYNTWTLSLVASMNLFDWGASHYRKIQAERKLDRLRADFEGVKNGIRLEAIQAVLLRKEAEERIRVAEENVGQAEENYKVTRDLFHQGMATNTEVLDANALLLRAKTDHISALADFKTAGVRLARAVGTIGQGE